MKVNANLAQDVFKDAGESVIFVMLSLKREDLEKEREIIADMADRMEAIQRSMNIRVAPEKVKIAFGFSNRAWEYLFPTAKKPKELEDFKGVNGRTTRRLRPLLISSFMCVRIRRQRVILLSIRSWASFVPLWTW